MKNRIFAFAHRCFLELVRDPLSYLFALGFPLVMLIVMTILNESIPAEAGMTVFRIDNLAPAVYVFGLSFLMLFTALLVSKDRSQAFLVRLYISPMRRMDFLLGYTLPVLALAVIQGMLTMAVAFGIGGITGTPLTPHPVGAVVSVVASLPSVVLFVGFGLLVGSLFNDKSAPPLSSVVISVSSFLGGMWMDVDNMSGAIVDICNALPFLHAVKIGRMALAMEFDGIAGHLVYVGIWSVVVYALAVAAFRRKL